MEKLIYFSQNHSINIVLIAYDIAPFLAIFTTLLFVVIWQVAQDIHDEAISLREQLTLAETKSENKTAENFALSFNNDCLTNENLVLKHKLESAEQKLGKYVKLNQQNHLN